MDIEVVTPMGAQVAGTRCKLSQGGAEWEVMPPARATVITSSADLLVRCEAGVGGARGEVRVPSQVEGGRGPRALVGAGIGGLVGGVVGKSDEGSYTRGVGRAAGAALGLGLGAAAGALSADPAYTYPAKVRVALDAKAPEASKP